MGFVSQHAVICPRNLHLLINQVRNLLVMNFKKNLNSALHIFLFSEFGDVIMTTLVISFTVL